MFLDASKEKIILLLIILCLHPFFRIRRNISNVLLLEMLRSDSIFLIMQSFMFNLLLTISLHYSFR